MDKFSLNNQIERIVRGENTFFLNPIDTKYIVNILKKIGCKYNVFYLFSDTEKLIVYQDVINITLFEIKCREKLSHQEILGALFSHNLSDEVFGDIVIDNDRYYIVILDKIKKYILANFNRIGNKKVELVESNLESVSSFSNKFRKIIIQVSSLRIDGVISKLIPTSRTISNEFISNQKVMLNYHILKNKNYILKEGDVFSIRGIGKFKFVEIRGINKRSKYQIIINKYL